MTARGLTVALAMSLAVASGCRAKSSSDSAPTAGATTSTTEASFNVEGRHCATCPVTVKTAAEGVPGVKSAKVSMADKRATVAYST